MAVQPSLVLIEHFDTFPQTACIVIQPTLKVGLEIRRLSFFTLPVQLESGEKLEGLMAFTNPQLASEYMRLAIEGGVVDGWECQDIFVVELELSELEDVVSYLMEILESKEGVVHLISAKTEPDDWHYQTFTFQLA